MRLSIVALACLGLMACESEQEISNEENAAAVVVLEEARFRAHIKTLASDEFGGRAPATEGEALTVAYLENEFRSLGLEPMNGDDYTQSVPLTSIILQGTPSLRISGDGDDLSLAYEEDQMVFTRRLMSQSQLQDSELVFVGYGINAPERNWNDYEGVDVKGKTVVMLVNDPGFATQDPEIFNGNAMTIYGRWTYKYAEAARQGAAGAIVVHETAAASYPWTTVTSGWGGPQFDIVRENKGEDLCQVEAWITTESATALFAKAGLNIDDLYEAAKQPGFQAIPLGLNANIVLDTEIEQTQSYNVGGLVKGTQSPEEIFLYTAHWDHLGTNHDIEGDGIYNGAIDNATGTAAILELARIFSQSQVKPKRSILFLAVGAEESGLLGSKYYAAHPLFPMNTTVAGINIDAMSVVGPTHDIVVVGHGQSQLDNLLVTAAQTQQRVVKPNPHPERGYYYRSDHFEFAKKGVPMMYAKSGHDHREHGPEFGKAKSDEYIANYYHQPSDEYSDEWDLSGAVEDLELYYLVGRAVVDSDQWPQWSEVSEFKAIRDESLAPQ
jgi:Zn-dependent M28 family amino/carboxypeptidase